MPTREFLKPRPRPWRWFSPPLGRRRRGGALVTLAALIALVVCGAWALNRWHSANRSHVEQSRLAPLVSELYAALDARWAATPHIPPFQRGDEAELQRMLQEHPVLSALVHRRERRVWVREGLCLREVKGGRLAHLGLRLSERLNGQELPWTFATRAEEGGLPVALTGAVRNEAWVCIRRLEPGSVALDAELALLLGTQPKLRLNLQHPEALPLTVASPYQLPTALAGSRPFKWGFWMRNQPMGWYWCFVPAPHLESAMWRTLAWKTAQPLLPLLLIGSLLALRAGLKARRRAQKARAQARLEALLRGLGKPLAGIRERCGQIRSGTVARDVVDCALIQVGEEVEHLSLLIENGLKAALGRGASKPGEPVTRAWLATLAEDYEAIFESAERPFVLNLQGEGARASLPALRQVLQALLENALVHGDGKVSLRTRRSGFRLFIEIEDEGRGLPIHALPELGQPFHRFPSGANEDQGLGMGLHLVLQLAEREGWGLSFASAEGLGFRATLELIAPWRPSWPRLSKAGPPRHHALKAQRRRTLGGRWERFLRGRRGGLLLGLISAALLLVGGAWGLQQWMEKARQDIRRTTFQPQCSQFTKAFTERWEASTPPPPFRNSDEAALRRFLGEQPLVLALVRREDAWRAWIRRGGRLVPETESPEALAYRGFAQRLWALHAPLWVPSDEDGPDPVHTLTGVAGGAQCAIIRGITPGTEPFEAELALLLGPDPPLRVGLQNGRGRHAFLPMLATRYEATFAPQALPAFSHRYWSRLQTRGWEWTLTPSPALARQLQGRFMAHVAFVLLPLGLILGLLALRLLLRRRLHQQAALAAVCLASLTHGLQTPLAVLKARCDSLRFGRMEKSVAESECQHMGEEVEHLLLVIDTLREAQRESRAEWLSLAWLSGFEQNFGPILQGQGRSLRTDFQGEGGPVALASLSPVLWTLLENGLKHGAGTVTFSSRREGRRLILEVCDEGPGLSEAQLGALGQPFLRFPSEGVGGLGLGLSLALQIAEREGWGFRISSERGVGLRVELAIDSQNSTPPHRSAT